MEVTHLSREDVSGIREASREDSRAPRILCWNCRRLTPFHEERCEYCGARFAGSTGGAYSKFKSVTARVPPAPSDDEELAEARRSLVQLFEDLQRVHDVSSIRGHIASREEERITLYQCPSCGRFVAEDAVDCACGVRFAAETSSVCPGCGAQIPEGAAACPVCAQRRHAGPSEIAYVCPLCGTEVSEDAVRCACGARFEA